MNITSPGGLSTGINNSYAQQRGNHKQSSNSNFIKLQSCQSQGHMPLKTQNDSSCYQATTIFAQQQVKTSSQHLLDSHEELNQDVGSPYDKQLEEHAQSVLKQIQCGDYSDDDDLFNTGKSTQANLVESQEEEQKYVSRKVYRDSFKAHVDRYNL